MSWFTNWLKNLAISLTINVAIPLLSKIVVFPGSGLVWAAVSDFLSHLLTASNQGQVSAMFHSQTHALIDQNSGAPAPADLVRD